MRLEKLKSLRKIACKNTRIRTVIAEVIEAKYAGSSSKKDSRTVFKLPFGSTTVDNVQVHRLLRDSVRTWPLDEWHLKDPRIARKLNAEVGSSFRNHTAASLDMPASRDSPCVCSDMPESVLWTDPQASTTERHVITTDIRTVLSHLNQSITSSQLDELQLLVNFHGAKFRRSVPLTITAQRLFECAMDFGRRCLKKQCDTEELEGDMEKRMKDWASELVDRFKSQLCGTDKSAQQRYDLAPLLESLHSRFVVTPADKNPQSSVIWCRRHYAQVLDGAVSKSFTERRDVEPEKVILEHAKLARSLCHPSFNTLPYLYAMPKVHRLETHRSPFRFIVGKSLKNSVSAPEGAAHWPLAVRNKNSLSSVRSHLATALNSIIDLLVRQDNARKVKRCWIVRDTQEFIDSIATMHHPTTFITQDFTTLYTNLDHDKVIDGVNRAIDDVLEPLAKLLDVSSSKVRGRDIREHNIYIAPDGAWHYGYDKERGRVWSIADIRRAVRTCVDSAELMFDGRIFKQTSGIGMGHEECVGVANLYLYSVESRWVDNKVSELGEQAVIDRYHGFRFHRRFVDDLFAPGGESSLPSEADYHGLKLATTYQGSRVVYLGVEVKVTDGRLSFRARDKQQAFDFKIVRFPSWESCVPKSVKRGTIMGMLTRTIRLTTDVSDLIEESRTMLRHFRERHYPEPFIVSSVKAFARRCVQSKFRAQFLQSLLEPPRVPPPPTPPLRPSAAAEDPPPEQSDSFLPSYIEDGGVNDLANDASTTSDAPRRRTSRRVRGRSRLVISLSQLARFARSASRHRHDREVQLDERRDQHDQSTPQAAPAAAASQPVHQDPAIAVDHPPPDQPAAAAAPAVPPAPAGAPPPDSSRPLPNANDRSVIEDVTAALCTAIQLRDRTTEPHDNVILEAIRDALSSQAQSSSQLAESVSNGIHDTILGALSAIREGSQRQADQASALQERAFEQLQAMPQMLRLFEERLNSERTLAMQMSAQMERIAENHASTLAELTSDNHRRQVAFIEAFKNQTEGFARLAQGTSDHQTVLVDRIETTHQQLHAASQSVLQLLVNQLSTSSIDRAFQRSAAPVSAGQCQPKRLRHRAACCGPPESATELPAGFLGFPGEPSPAGTGVFLGERRSDTLANRRTPTLTVSCRRVRFGN